MNQRTLALALSLASLPFVAYADGIEHDHMTSAQLPATSFARPDDHAPLSVMGDHMHRAGEVMISVRHMRMEMSDLRMGRDDVSDATALATPNIHGGMSATLRSLPRRMTSDMTMFGAMYGLSDNVTLMAMTQYLEKKMRAQVYNMSNASLGQFTARSEGFGDTTLSALFRLPAAPGGHLHAGLGLSIPTGSIKESDTVLSPMNQYITTRLPYGMQLGSGTYDLKPSVTYTHLFDRSSVGIQIGGTFRLDDNQQGYALGDQKYLKLWGARTLSENVSTSLQLAGTTTQNISGQDPQINKPVQSANPFFYGGDRIEMGWGINWIGTRGVLAGHRFGGELSAPVYEKVNGLQLSHDWTLTIGYQKSW